MYASWKGVSVIGRHLYREWAGLGGYLFWGGPLILLERDLLGLERGREKVECDSLFEFYAIQALSDGRSGM